MNREIKFRAWDLKSKKMRIIESIGFGVLSSLKEGYPVVNMIGRDCINDKYIIVHRDCPQFELMQYTGLKDKNGKEIYERDIVNIINDSVDEEDGYFLVEYENETARFILSGNRLVYDFDNTYTNECEIVGNIYENPKLLEVSNE